MSERTELSGVRLIILGFVPVVAFYLMFFTTTALREEISTLSNDVFTKTMAGDASGPSVFEDGTFDDLNRLREYVEKFWLTLTFTLAAGLGAWLSPRLTPRSVVKGVMAIGIGLTLGSGIKQSMSIFDASDWVLIANCLSVALAGYACRRLWQEARRT